MLEKTVRTPAMSCSHCVRSIEREVADMKGVTYVKADLATKSVTIRWEEPATWEKIRTLLAQIGYPPQE